MEVYELGFITTVPGELGGGQVTSLSLSIYLLRLRSILITGRKHYRNVIK